MNVEKLLLVLFMLVISAGSFLLGSFTGYMAGKRKALTLLDALVGTMEDLRRASKTKAYYKTNHIVNGRVDEGIRLENELAAESTIFYEVQNAVSDWCIENDLKDPFAL